MSPAHARVISLRPDTLSDAELVANVRRGDRRAEESLFRRHFAAVAATVARLLHDRHEAEDVVQDALMTALTELATLRDPASFRAWVLQIAVRKVHRRFRRRTLLRALGLASGEPVGGLESLAAEDASADVRAELALLDRVLGRLASANRIAWTLRYVEGMQLEQVAVTCGCSLATAKRRIAAADQEVRAHVGLDDPKESL